MTSTQPPTPAALAKARQRDVQYDTYAQAREAVDQQREFAILQLHSGAAELDLSSASGATVAEVLAQVSPQAAQSIGHTVTVRDINPLQPGDPRGLAIFYITLATVIVGFVSAIQLSVHARALRLGQLMAVTASYAALGGLAIIAVIDWGLGTLQLPVAESWLILSLTLFTSGAIFQMFKSLVGRWALAPTWILLVILGSPTSGGAVAWPLLPTPLRMIGQWLPTGAAVNAQHTAIYFSQNRYVFPFLVLLAWAVVSWTVVALRRRATPPRHRHRRRPARAPNRAGGPSSGHWRPGGLVQPGGQALARREVRPCVEVSDGLRP